MHKDEWMLSDEFETFQTKALRSLIGRVIFECLIHFTAVMSEKKKRCETVIIIIKVNKRWNQIGDETK